MIPIKHDSGVLVFDLDRVDWRDPAQRAPRRNGLAVGYATDELPAEAGPFLEALTCTIAPRGPGRCWAAGTADDLAAIIDTARTNPDAASVLDSVLRVDAPSTYAALSVESFAYSMLLAGPEFTRWRAATPRREITEPLEPVLLDRVDDVLTICLNHPARRNAFRQSVRQGLYAALELVAIDSSIRAAVLMGNGPSFCSGGDLDEFGTAPDPVTAHRVRMAQSPAMAMHRIRDRAQVMVHGACIGAGIEIPSFSQRVTARPNSTFRLPELSMGLIPGAGGTVSIPRRIGKWRTAFMALTGAEVGVSTARDWGLVDEVVAV